MDRSWTVASTIVALISAPLSVYFYWQARQVRRLSVSFDGPINLHLPTETIKGKAKEQITVRFGGDEIRSLSILNVTVRNTGTQPVLAAQMETPIRFTFPQDTILKDVSITDQSDDLHITPESTDTSSGHVSEWCFRSLCKGEYFTLQFLLDGKPDSAPKVDARIPGFKIALPAAPRSRLRELIEFGVVLLAGGLLVTAIQSLADYFGIDLPSLPRKSGGP